MISFISDVKDEV